MQSKEDQISWYTDAKRYWDNLESTNDAMLGGHADLSNIDAAASGRFIAEFLKNGMIKENGYACDCGAGIGRVTKTFLLKHFRKVDLVEQTEKFLHQAELDFKAAGLLDRVEFIPTGLQSFTPFRNKYDLIWCQWVLSHLTDKDLLEFFKRCIAAAPFIGVKENVTKLKTIYDEFQDAM